MTTHLPVDVSRLLSAILVQCVDIRMVWSVGYASRVEDGPRRLHELLLFADARTLRMLRKCDHLHRADVHALVVFDGEQFDTAWGAYRVSGSLARWAWREVSPDLAYYDESKWEDRDGEPGSIVRLRRKAVLVWRCQS